MTAKRLWNSRNFVANPFVQLTDVTLRDGLQMEAQVFSTEQKLSLLSSLLEVGYSRLEVTSFVNPKWVPQFSDSDTFCQRALAKAERAGAELMAFVPNEKGLERLLPHSIPWVSGFIACSETFNLRNINQTIDQTIVELRRIVFRARSENRKIRIYLSTVFGCPYEGEISAAQLKSVFERIVALGPEEITLSDTIGVAVAPRVAEVLETFLRLFPANRTSLHFHNTYGLALAAAQAGLAAGVTQFDGTTGGIGGCPYARGATGNVATEELAYAFFRQGKLATFPLEPIKKVWKSLHDDLKITLHSHLFDIVQKGGEIYGVGK